MTSAGEWRVARQISFRFGILFAGCLIFPFPLTVIPKAGSVVEWVASPVDLAAI